MSKLTLWNWEEKQKTQGRYVKEGNIFCFQYDEEMYCFGRIISKLKTGTIIEIFDYTSNEPKITKDIIDNSKRMFPPININILILFDRKISGDWRIIGKQDNFKPTNIDDVFFTIGRPPSKKNRYFW